jgi:hypothetical protein
MKEKRSGQMDHDAECFLRILIFERWRQKNLTFGEDEVSFLGVAIKIGFVSKMIGLLLNYV